MTEQHINDERLEELLDELEIEKAPASLTAKLERIPEQEKRPARAAERGKRWAFPSWLAAPAFAAVPLMVLVMMMNQTRPPTDADVEQARQDLATAFAYIDSVGMRTGDEIHSILGQGLKRSVKEPLTRHLPYTQQSRKEDSI